jgi:hypothetical protein
MQREEILAVVEDILLESPGQMDLLFIPDDLFYALDLRWSQFKFNDNESLEVIRFLLSRIENYNTIPTCSRSEALWCMQLLRKLIVENDGVKELFYKRIPSREKKALMSSVQKLDSEEPLPTSFAFLLGRTQASS